jgi:4-hydroxy-3-polyprenylbenzoate decarboxylase
VLWIALRAWSEAGPVDAGSVQALACHALRCTPRVSLAPAAVLMEVSTSLRLFGGLAPLLAQLRQPQPPRSLGEAAELLPLVKTVLAMKPKTVSSPPCQEVVLRGDDIDLNKLPVMTCWPGEPAPLITWPLVVTKGPSDSREDNFNLGIYRMQVLNKNQTIMRWLKHRGGAQHHHRWGKKNPKPLPAAAVIGARPK